MDCENLDPKQVIESLLSQKEFPDEISKKIGFELISCSDGKSTIALQASKKHHNPFGTLQGTVQFVVINFQINFFKAVVEDTITVIAKCLSRSKLIGFVECELVNSKNVVIAKATATCKVIIV